MGKPVSISYSRLSCSGTASKVQSNSWKLMFRKTVAAQGAKGTGCSYYFYEYWALKFNLLVNRKQNKNRNKISEVNSFQKHVLKRLSCVMGNFSVQGTLQEIRFLQPWQSETAK